MRSLESPVQYKRRRTKMAAVVENVVKL
ncbi:zinc finger protein ubi-d4 isoform X1, partial [Tachysurus ichikawai]